MLKKKLLVASSVFVVLFAFASIAISVDANQSAVIMPTAEAQNITSNGTISNQINFDEKFTHTFINGCYLECPLNMKGINGTIKIRRCTVFEPDITQNYKGRFMFEHSGPNSMNEKFYIRAYDINGIMIDELKLMTDYDQDYNPIKKKYIYKVLPTDATYFIPLEAARVVVTNDYTG